MSWYNIHKDSKLPKFCKSCGQEIKFRDSRRIFEPYDEQTGKQIIDKQYGCDNSQCASNSQDMT